MKEIHLSVATYSLLVLSALAAVVLGRFTSITWAVVGSPAEVRDNAQVIAAFLGPEAA